MTFSPRTLPVTPHSAMAPYVVYLGARHSPIVLLLGENTHMIITEICLEQLQSWFAQVLVSNWWQETNGMRFQESVGISHWVLVPQEHKKIPDNLGWTEIPLFPSGLPRPMILPDDHINRWPSPTHSYLHFLPGSYIFLFVCFYDVKNW